MSQRSDAASTSHPLSQYKLTYLFFTPYHHLLTVTGNRIHYHTTASRPHIFTLTKSWLSVDGATPEVADAVKAATLEVDEEEEASMAEAEAEAASVAIEEAVASVVIEAAAALVVEAVLKGPKFSSEHGDRIVVTSHLTNLAAPVTASQSRTPR
jgi:hypothetical protein